MSSDPNNPYVASQTSGPQAVPVGYMPTPDERTWATFAHLAGLVAAWLGGFSFLGPLIIWFLKKDQSPFVADQAKEALNFQIAVTIALWISIALIWVFCIGLITMMVVGIGSIIYSIIAAMEANKGVHYRYPYTIRLIA
jgi:uncharacterized Tic20 family protein